MGTKGYRIPSRGHNNYERPRFRARVGEYPVEKANCDKYAPNLLLYTRQPTDGICPSGYSRQGRDLCKHDVGHSLTLARTSLIVQKSVDEQLQRCSNVKRCK